MKIKKLQKAKDDIKVYHSKNCISASGLKTIALNDFSVQHYLNKEFKKSDAMELGIAAHILLLEGLTEFENQYFVLPKLDLRKTENKKLKAEIEEKNSLKQSLSNDNYIKLIKMYDNLQDKADTLYYCKGDYEISHYGTYCDVDVRVRPDCMTKDWISDLKTCQRSNIKSFRNDVYKYAYHIQATFYCDMLGYDPKKFRWIAAETNAPFAVQHYGMTDKMIEYGRNGWQKAFHYWKEYVDKNIVSSYIGTDVADDGAILI